MKCSSSVNPAEKASADHVVVLFKVENLVAIELSYINTKHPDFHDAALAGTLAKEVTKRNKVAEVNGLPAATAGEGDKPAAPSGKTAQALALRPNAPSEALGWIGNVVGAVTAAGRGESGANTPDQASPMHHPSLAAAGSPMKPVNLLPEEPTAGSRKLSPREQRDCEVIERLIRSYFLIVRKNIQDSWDLRIKQDGKVGTS
ncbi:putative dynamin [Ixodes scapularis]